MHTDKLEPAVTAESGGQQVAGTSWERRIGLSLFALALLWGIACLAAHWWLEAHVPLTAQDVRMSSWLTSRTGHLILSVVLTPIVFIGALMNGIGQLLERGSLGALLVSGLIAAMAFFAGENEGAVRVGVAHGSVKIGCYVYESRECRTMLGVPAESAPSRYAEHGSGSLYADWYKRALAQKTQLTQRDISRANLPAYYFFMGPFYAFDHERINAELAKQREEVVKFREAAGVAVPR